MKFFPSAFPQKIVNDPALVHNKNCCECGTPSNNLEMYCVSEKWYCEACYNLKFKELQKRVNNNSKQGFVQKIHG
jgi:hypothetical protein